MDSLSLAYGLLCLAGGVGLFFYAWRDFQAARDVNQTDTVPIRDLEHTAGRATITGVVRPDEETVRSLFMRQECVACECEAFGYSEASENSTDPLPPLSLVLGLPGVPSHESDGWQPLGSASASVPFLVEDDTGTVRIDPTDATLQLMDHGSNRSDAVVPLDEVLDSLESDLALADTYDDSSLDVAALRRTTSQQFSERRLEVGDTVSVHGSVKQTSGGTWGSDRVGATLTATPDGTFAVSETAEPEAGREQTNGPLLVAAMGLVFVGAGIAFLLDAVGMLAL